MDVFIKRLQSLLDENDMNQKELANKVGVTEVTISRYMNGDRKPRIEIANKIAAVLGATTDYLLGNSDIKNPYGDKVTKMNQREKVDYDDFMKQAKVHFMGASPEDQDAIFKDLSDLYFESKEINRKKFNPKKNKK